MVCPTLPGYPIKHPNIHPGPKGFPMSYENFLSVLLGYNQVQPYASLTNGMQQGSGGQPAERVTNHKRAGTTNRGTTHRGTEGTNGGQNPKAVRFAQKRPNFGP